MKSFKYLFVVVPLVLLAMVATPLLRGEIGVDPSLADEMKQYKNEISLLNLLGGLYLSPNQLERLIDLAREADLAREPVFEHNRAQARAMRDALRALRDGAYASTGAPKEVKNAATGLNKGGKELASACHNKIADLETQARTVLNPGQLKIIGTFKPCLVPPKNLRDPVSVGQVDTGADKILALMDTLRSAPDHVYRVKEPEILLRIVEHIECEKGKMKPEVRASVRKSMTERIRRVRGMNDADYELEKMKLAQELMPFDETTVVHKGKRKTGLVAKWFLAPFSSSVLAKWRDERRRDPIQMNVEPQAMASGAKGKNNPFSEEERQQRFYLRNARKMTRQWRKSGKKLRQFQPELRNMNQAAKRGDIASASQLAKVIISRVEEMGITEEAVQYRKQLAMQLGRERGFKLGNGKQGHKGKKGKKGHGDAYSQEEPPKDLFGINKQFEAACAAHSQGDLRSAHRQFIALAQTISEFRR